MNNKITAQSEMQKRLDLIEDEAFRKSVIDTCVKFGMTAKEWNENKAWYLMYFANQICGKV